MRNKKWLLLHREEEPAVIVRCDEEAQRAIGALGRELTLPSPGGWKKKYLSCGLKDEQEFGKHRKKWMETVWAQGT